MRRARPASRLPTTARPVTNRARPRRGLARAGRLSVSSDRSARDGVRSCASRRGTALQCDELEGSAGTCPNGASGTLQIEFGVDRLWIDDRVAPLIEGDALWQAQQTDPMSVTACTVEVDEIARRRLGRLARPFHLHLTPPSHGVGGRARGAGDVPGDANAPRLRRCRARSPRARWRRRMATSTPPPDRDGELPESGDVAASSSTLTDQLHQLGDGGKPGRARPTLTGGLVGHPFEDPCRLGEPTGLIVEHRDQAAAHRCTDLTQRVAVDRGAPGRHAVHPGTRVAAEQEGLWADRRGRPPRSRAPRR